MEKNDDCWDLFAVVRSCRVATRSPPARPPPPPLPEPIIPSSFQELTESSHLELEKLWNPLFSVSQQPKPPTPLPCSSPSASAATVAATPRFMKQTRPLSQTKRRKKQQKRDVLQVRADGLAADMWAWRKYGQKPIKGSPYPRGYYRCSSSKGCLARKQVERSQIDPGMFVITYSGEHNHPLPTHRNSLAGTTRQKLPLPGVSGEQGNSSSEEVLLKEEEEEEEEEEGMLLVEDMEVVGEDQVLFMGSEQVDASAVGTEDAVAGGGSDEDFLRSWLEDNGGATASIR